MESAIFFNLEDFNANFYYLSKFEGLGILVITKNEKKLYVPAMDYNKKSKIKKVLLKDIKDINLKHKKIGIDFNSVTLSQLNKLKKYTKAKFYDFKVDRSIKDKNEIKKIKQCCDIAKKAFDYLIKNWNFKNEGEVRACLEHEIKKRGGDIAFPTIIASGKNGRFPHYNKSSKLNKGFCIIDFGVKKNHYCCDITRSVYIGNPSKEDIEKYNKILNIQNEIIKKCVPGKKIKELDIEVRKKLGKDAKYFIHSLGHGIGLEVHEKPNISEKAKGELKKNMIIAIEPGVYNKYGIRIEDNILVSKKPEILSKIKKELIIIK